MFTPPEYVLAEHHYRVRQLTGPNAHRPHKHLCVTGNRRASITRPPCEVERPVAVFDTIGRPSRITLMAAHVVALVQCPRHRLLGLTKRLCLGTAGTPSCDGTLAS